MTDADTAPLIVTARLEPPAQARFDALRRLHFPPALNKIPAHITLFHALPGTQLETVTADLAAACASRATMQLAATGLRFLGRGVAVAIEAPGLAALRAELAARWHAVLSAQDRQAFKPHVTIQNKVEPAVARALHAALQAGFEPWTFAADGARLWLYRGGPWALQADMAFARAGF